MKLVVTGAKGQLGRDVVAACEAAGDDVIGTDLPELDLTRRDHVLGAIGSWRPDAVIHCAAYTAVDDCESNVDLAYQANAVATRWVADAARRFDAHLLYISTDYVFSGEQPEPYDEWSRPDPLSVYGRSKLAGEHELGPEATIVRISWVAGEHGNNMVKTILRLAAERPELAFVDDQRGCPTFTADLAPMLRRLVVDRRPGIHHVTNQGAVSWYEFARAVLEAGGHDPDRVSPITTADLQPPRPAPRPKNSVLDNKVLRLSGVPLLDDFHEPLGRLVARLQA